MRAPTLPFANNVTNWVSRNTILTRAHYTLWTNKVVHRRKKYLANIAEGNDIRYHDNKVLVNIRRFDIRCVDCFIIGRASPDGKVLMHHAASHDAYTVLSGGPDRHKTGQPHTRALITHYKRCERAEFIFFSAARLRRALRMFDVCNVTPIHRDYRAA